MAGTVATKTAAADSQKSSQAPALTSKPVNNKPSRISRFVAAFLRVSLLPIIAFGIPLWPILAFLCAIPFVSVFVFPFFLALTLALMYAIAWFSYLILAQSDPPYRRSLGGGASYLPFLPYSPMRCLKINWAAFLYLTTALRVAIPAVLDWSYRRVIVLGTQAGAGIVKEGVLYGSPYPGKRLDIYLPPNFVAASGSSGSTSQSSSTGTARRPGMRTRKHSYVFDEPGVMAEGGPATDGASVNRGSAPAPSRTATAPVVVVLPSIIPPLTWTNKRKTYLQLALRLRRLGYCVVVPDITYFPEARIKASIVDLRLVLRWVGANIGRFGGDPNKIHVMGHGFSAHLITLTLTQEAVVLSREGFLDRAYDREQRALEQQQRNDGMTDDGRSEWDDASSIGDEETSGKHLGDAEPSRQNDVAFPSSSPSQANGRKSGQQQNGADGWVDEPGGSGKQNGANGSKDGSGVPPGYVMGSTQQFNQDFDAASPQLGLSDLDNMSPTAKDKGKAAVIGDDAASASGLTFPSSASQNNPVEDVDDPFTSPPRKTMTLTHRRKGSRSAQADDGEAKSNKGRSIRPRSQSRTYSSSSQNGVGSYGFHQKEPQTLSEAEEQISNGLNRVEIYEPEIELPPIAGVILLAGVSDVIKGFRNETDRGIEHLSVLRRAMGPSHTSCLLHSPAHLLFAAKNMLDTALLPPKFLLIHGGKDAVVPIEQSTLMKTLLVGVGINHVSLRAYRELGHAEALAALFLGMGKSSTKYAKQIAQDIVDFVEL